MIMLTKDIFAYSSLHTRHYIAENTEVLLTLSYRKGLETGK